MTNTNSADTYPSNFKPNFTCDFSVTIPKPLDTVFPILGTSQGLGPTIGLSALASDFETLTLDAVVTEGKLEDASVRTALAGPSESGFPRQAFRLKENIPIIPGLSFLNVVVSLEGTFTWDEEMHVALYETTSDKGVTVRKVRWFEAVDEGTRVTEHIDGHCAPLLQPITQRLARDAHRKHMNLYHTLF